MSFIDSRWEIWDNQALTVEEESRTNGNVFDLEEDGVTDESISQNLWLNVQVGTAFATLTEGCYIAILTSDNADFSADVRCIGAIGCEDYPILVTELTAGAVFSIAVCAYTLNKYLELLFEPISSAASAGALDAWFGLEPLSPLKVMRHPYE